MSNRSGCFPALYFTTYTNDVINGPFVLTYDTQKTLSIAEDADYY